MKQPTYSARRHQGVGRHSPPSTTRSSSRRTPTWCAACFRSGSPWPGSSRCTSSGTGTTRACREAQRVNYAKEHAHRMWSRAARGARLPHLHGPARADPQPGELDYGSSPTFSRAAGRHARATQAGAPAHASRAARGTRRSDANHTEPRDRPLHLFLERLLACKDVKSEPWNMPELKKKPRGWFAKDARIISRDGARRRRGRVHARGVHPGHHARPARAAHGLPHAALSGTHSPPGVHTPSPVLRSSNL